MFFTPRWEKSRINIHYGERACLSHRANKNNPLKFQLCNLMTSMESVETGRNWVGRKPSPTAEIPSGTPASIWNTISTRSRGWDCVSSMWTATLVTLGNMIIWELPSVLLLKYWLLRTIRWANKNKSQIIVILLSYLWICLRIVIILETVEFSRSQQWR